MSKDFQSEKDPVISQEELRGILPKVYSKEAWQDPDLIRKLTTILDKLEKATSDDSIQCIDGTVLTYNELGEYPKKIFDKTQDYSFSIALGESLSEALQEKEIGESSNAQNTREVFTDAVIQKIPLISQDTALFEAGIKQELLSKDYTPSDVDDFTESLLRRYREQGLKELQAIDAQLLEKLGEDKSIKGLEYFISHESEAKTGVLICTSDGGGCHRNIAGIAKRSFESSGISCAILNESQMTAIDPLSKFIGIPFSQLYPIVFQQCDGSEARNLLISISGFLNTKFLPQFRFAQLREAAKQVHQQIKHEVVYSTQHYATDVFAIPEGGVGFFQVCDYGGLSSLTALAKAAEPIQTNIQIKFFVPSETCIPKDNKRVAAEIHSELLQESQYLETLYPCTILKEDESQKIFEDFTRANDLTSPENKEVIRISLIMGGQGNEELILKMLDTILKDRDKYPDQKFELVVGCGRNVELKRKVEEAIASKRDDGGLGNFTVKAMGFIDNSSLVAYNKNAVLVTKPGGGTVGEAISNKIQSLLVYEAAHWWERPNVTEATAKGLGEELDRDRSVLEQIVDANKARLARMQGENEAAPVTRASPINIIHDEIRKRDEIKRRDASQKHMIHDDIKKHTIHDDVKKRDESKKPK